MIIFIYAMKQFGVPIMSKRALNTKIQNVMTLCLTLYLSCRIQILSKTPDTTYRLKFFTHTSNLQVVYCHWLFIPKWVLFSGKGWRAAKTEEGHLVIVHTFLPHTQKLSSQHLCSWNGVIKKRFKQTSLIQKHMLMVKSHRMVLFPSP